MTAIAFRDGILAADSLMSCNGTRVGSTSKIVRGPDGDLGAASGPSGATEAFRAWIGLPDPRPPFDPECETGQFEAIVVRPNSDVLYLDHTGRSCVVVAPFHAIGSASEIMVGAMAMGATAVRAVEIAIQFDVYCGGPIDSAAINDRSRPDRPGGPA